MKTLTQSFCERVRLPEQPDGCWEWIGHRNQDGYGKFSLGRRVVGEKRYASAHRWSYERFTGPIPEGLVIDHSACDNPGCVNPGHLKAVTTQENIMRGNGACARHARKTHCKRGHPLSGDNVYVDPRGGRICRACRKLVDIEARIRGPKEHGKTNIYATYKCRCDLCRAAWAAYKRRTKTSRATQEPTVEAA